MPTPLWSDNPAEIDLLGFADVTAPVVEAVLRDKLDPVTVGIEGDWGSGKTSMLGVLATELREDKKVVVIETHPWEYDPATDPKATLIAEVLGVIHVEAEKRNGLSDKAREKFKALARRIQVSKAIKLGVNSVLSMGLPKLDEITELFTKDAETVPDPTLQGFREEFDELMELLKDIDRVVVLVDDLDRCLPPTVIATLEAVKLFLSVQKMAFVIAADRRAVSHAIASQYDPSPLADELGRQYLEKIVQIPIRVPALGLADSEAYLALLLLERHLDQKKLAPLVKHCRGRRAGGEAEILTDLPRDDLSPDAEEDLQVAAMLAPILYEPLAGNPRRLKRFLNAYWMRDTVAKRRGISLKPDALAKLMVLEELDDAGINALIDWLREGTLVDRLKTLEAGEPPDGVSEAALALLKPWSAIGPELSGIEDLDSYVRLAATLRSQVGPEAGLQGEAKKLADALLSPRTAEAKDARRKGIEGASPDARLQVAKYLVRLLSTRPDDQDRIGPALGELAKDAAIAEAIALGLAEVPAKVVDGALIVALLPDDGAYDSIKKVVSGWVESDRLDGPVQAIAKKKLEGKEQG